MTGFRLILCGLVAVCILAAFPAYAQNPDSEKPLEISAQDTLEWHRDTQQYIARGAVIAQQGSMTLRADVLTADYRETAEKNFDIYRLTAAGHVVISSPDMSAFGDKAVYDVDGGVAVVTGDALRMTSPDQTVTARDSFEYWVNEGKLTALGGAKVVRGTDTITADRMAALFSKGPDGKDALKRLEANDNVVITTPTEVLSGDRATYDAQTDTAELIGKVKIARGPNTLEGQRATVNLTTNVSMMHGGAPDGTGDTRVRGVFYPGTD
ncbi:MAG: ostA-like family protein [Alphaproteobacteria bacterium]|nr:ostA-like family protein [Alphaproteobacteria bacterium]